MISSEGGPVSDQPVEATSSSPDTEAQSAAKLADLAAREAAVAQKEADVAAAGVRLAADHHQLQEERQSLADIEKELTQRGAEQAKLDADLATRKREVLRLQGEVDARTRVVTQREQEADEGFQAKSRDAAAALAKQLAALRAQIDDTRRQLEAEQIQGSIRVDADLARERERRFAALEAEISDRRQRADREIDENRARENARIAAERQHHDAAIATERARLTAERTTFEAEIEPTRIALAEKERELRHETTKIQWRKEEFEALRAEILRAAEERTKEQIGIKDRELRDLRGDYDRLLEERTRLSRQVDAHAHLTARLGGSPEEILTKLNDANKRIAALEQELLRRPSASDKELLVGLQEQHRTWSDERARLLVEVDQLNAQRHRWHIGVHELEAQREQRELAERRLEALRGEMEKYATDVARMRTLYEQPEERDARIGAIEQPWRTDLKRAPDDAKQSELDWLSRITASCEASGMRFPQRLVHAFHTSLKTAELSPLTVLAGVSGTGKSELPRLYSRFGGIAFLSLAVQPNWDSPQSLFGFFNSVDNRFNATTVLRAMVQAQHAPDHDEYEHGFSDRLLLVLLDEMNLAHVEQYFSDLLSRLEQRRGERNGVSLDIDVGAGMPPYPLNLGRNVLWVGTMNEDETTKALSDKVVDRSNLLHFPRPRTLHSRADVSLGEEAPLLAESTWRRWVVTRSPFTPSDTDPFRLALEQINTHLEHVGRALGHRVWQAVEFYMANHPDTITARERGDREALQRAMRRAFEDQLVLKVMPKLRGIETSGDSKRNCLDPIRTQLEDANLGLGLSEDFDIACRVGYGAFVWNSARYLESSE
jgi:hypothetical protein